jgi:hypothetical protein
MTRAKGLAIAAALAGAILVPLYGDPRPSPVTHAEWARLLLRALDLAEALPASATDREVFSVLSWKETLSFAADRYLRADGLRAREVAGVTRVEAGDAVGEVAYALAIVRGGDYRLRLQLAGEPARPAAAEITRLGRTTPAAIFSVPLAGQATWADVGSVHLDPGVHTASIQLPPHAALEHVEVVPPCLNAIEPPGGWKSRNVLQTSELAVTVLKAVDGEPQLAPTAPPIEVRGSDFQPLDTAPAVVPVSSALEGSWLLAGPRGRQAAVSVSVPEAGLYTIWVYGYVGGGQSWMADRCRKAILCPTAPPQAAGWSHLMTDDFLPGPHTFVVTLGPEAAVRALRLERKRSGPYDYAAAVARLGFEPGPAGPAPRAKVLEAARFVEARRRARIETCGDIPPPLVLTAGNALAQPARLAQPQSQAPNVGTGISPLAPSGPFTEPAAPPTPVIVVSPPVPVITPTPPPQPTEPEPPVRPSPTPAAPPATLALAPTPSPCQPPASPVTPNPCGP